MTGPRPADAGIATCWTPRCSQKPMIWAKPSSWWIERPGPRRRRAGCVALPGARATWCLRPSRPLGRGPTQMSRPRRRRPPLASTAGEHDGGRRVGPRPTTGGSAGTSPRCPPWASPQVPGWFLGRSGPRPPTRPPLEDALRRRFIAGVELSRSRAAPFGRAAHAISELARDVGGDQKARSSCGRPCRSWSDAGASSGARSAPCEPRPRSW